MERKENAVERDETESVKQEINHNKEAERNETDVNDKNPEDEISNKRMDETAVLEMVELIRPTWRENFEYFLKVDLKDRIYTTRKDRRISDIEIEATNRIMDQIIKETGDSISLWDINVMQYTTAITLISQHCKLREEKTGKKDNKTNGWMVNIMNKINSIRQKLSHINLIMKCREENRFTPKQRKIEKKLKKLFGSVRKERLTEMESRLKHDLSVQSKILRQARTRTEFCEFSNSVKFSNNCQYILFHNKDMNPRICRPSKFCVSPNCREHFSLIEEHSLVKATYVNV